MSELLAYGGLGFQLIALVFLARGPISRYFPLFLYLFTLISVTGVEGWILNTEGTSSPHYFTVYWGSEMLVDLLVMIMIVQLTSRVLEGNPLRPKMVQLLIGVMVIALIVPFVVFDSTVFGRRWNQSVGQLLNFGAAVMNLVLWSAVIVSKQRDRQLLTVSAGLGIAVAGAALTLGVRQFTSQGDTLRTITDFVYRICQIAGPAIWCWAFRPVKKNGTEAPPAIVTTPSAG